MEKPLISVKVVVTRAREQAGEFVSLLEDMGAEVISFPTIEFKEPEDLSVINGAIQGLSDVKNAYDWIIFTSANGVKFFFKRLSALSLDISVIAGVRVGVVGPKTASTLREHGADIDLIPEDYSAEGLIEGLLAEGIKDKKVLLVRALLGREILPDTLREKGADVTLAPVYETVAPTGLDKSDILSAFYQKGETILTFTSGSTVKNFFKMFDHRETELLLNKSKIAVISPVTARVAMSMGINVDIIPEVYTTKDLAYAIADSMIDE